MAGEGVTKSCGVKTGYGPYGWGWSEYFWGGRGEGELLFLMYLSIINRRLREWIKTSTAPLCFSLYAVLLP